jgi:hypothetical protein
MQLCTGRQMPEKMGETLSQDEKPTIENWS